MSDKSAPEIVVRKVRVLEPMLGEIEVELDITAIATAIARTAYKNCHGTTDAKMHVRCKAKCSKETLAARKAYLALNNEKREKLNPKLEVLPP